MSDLTIHAPIAGTILTRSAVYAGKYLFKEDRVKQVLGLKLGLRGAYGYAKPGVPADGRIQLQTQQAQAQAGRS